MFQIPFKKVLNLLKTVQTSFLEDILNPRVRTTSSLLVVRSMGTLEDVIFQGAKKSGRRGLRTVGGRVMFFFLQGIKNKSSSVDFPRVSKVGKFGCFETMKSSNISKGPSNFTCY